MIRIREQVVTDIENLWQYVCQMQKRWIEKFPLEHLYYLHILYEYQTVVVNEFESKGVKPNKMLLETMQDNIEYWKYEMIPLCRENMTRENKCNFFFELYNENKELSLTLKKVIESDYKLYSYNIHNKVFIMHEYLHEGVNDIVALIKTYNEILDKILALIPRLERLWAEDTK